MRKKLSFSTVLLFTTFCLANSAEAQSPPKLRKKGFNKEIIRINPDLPASPPEKEGYTLIFAEDFNALDPDVWNISDPGNDGPPYDYPDFCHWYKNAPHNPSNVFIDNGILFLQAREGEDQNACSHSASEIKSFSFSSANEAFNNWVVPARSYVEVRSKVPGCKGVGAAFWLWHQGDGAGRSEPDIFELYKKRRDRFQSNFHSAEVDYDTKETYFQQPRTIKVRDEKGKAVQLPDQFLNFGIYLDESQLSMELNGVSYYEQQMYYDKKGKFIPYKKHRPYWLRLGTGPALRGGELRNCKNLPDSYQVEYVRVYVEKGVNAVKILGSDFEEAGAVIVCSAYDFGGFGTGDNVYASYYPGATYAWEFDADILSMEQASEYNKKALKHFWVKPRSGAPSGVYPCTLTIDFPTGHQETLHLSIAVQNEAPLAPTEIFFVPENEGYSKVAVLQQHGSTGYEWSLDGGATWVFTPNRQNTGGMNVFTGINAPGELQVCVRTVNKCGVSIPLCDTLSIPVSGGEAEQLFFLNSPPAADSIYPVFIEKQPEALPESLEMYSILGALVWKGAYPGPVTWQPGLWNLPPGLYIAVTRDARGNILSVQKIAFI